MAFDPSLLEPVPETKKSGFDPSLLAPDTTMMTPDLATRLRGQMQAGDIGRMNSSLLESQEGLGRTGLAVAEKLRESEAQPGGLLNLNEWTEAAKNFLPHRLLNRLVGNPPDAPFIPESISKPLSYAFKTSVGDLAGMVPGMTPGARKTVEGASGSAADMALSFANPDVMVGGAGMKAGGLTAEAIKAAFATQMLSAAPDAYKKTTQALRFGSESDIAGSMTDLAAAVGLPLVIVKSSFEKSSLPKMQSGRPPTERTTDASEISSPESVSQPAIRPPVGGQTPLRQQGQVEGARPQEQVKEEITPSTAQPQQEAPVAVKPEDLKLHEFTDQEDAAHQLVLSNLQPVDEPTIKRVLKWASENTQWPKDFIMFRGREGSPSEGLEAALTPISKRGQPYQVTFFARDPRGNLTPIGDVPVSSLDEGIRNAYQRNFEHAESEEAPLQTVPGTVAEPQGASPAASAEVSSGTKASDAAPKRLKLKGSPQTFELVERLPQSDIEKENGEQPIRVKNERTGKVETMLESDFTPVSETATPKAKAKTTDEKLADLGWTKQQLSALSKDEKAALLSRKQRPAGKGPGVVGMGGAKAEQFSERQSAMQELWDKATKPFRKAVNTAKIAARTRSIKDAMAVLKDAGENTARVFARQQSNDIRNPIKRKFGKDAAKAEDALSFFVEAGGAEGRPADEVAQNLRDAIDKMRDSQKAGAKWRDRGIDAATFALYHQEELGEIAQRYAEITSEQVKRENARGEDTLPRRRYVMHMQDLEDESLGWFDKKGDGEPSGFRKKRTYPTFADSIASGIDPKTLNSVDLLERRLANGEMLANGRAWIDTFRDTVDPKTGKPVFEHPQYEERADGSKYAVAPDGYSLEQLGKFHVAVQNGYEGVARALTDPSLFSKSLGTRVLMNANALGKSGRLAIDTFHVGRVALWQAALRATGLERPFPSYRKGRILLDYTPAEISKMGENGEIPKEWVQPLLDAKPAHELMLKTGFNIGRITDNLHQEWIRNTPVLGRFNKWVFDEFTRGAMSELWQSEYKRLKEARPEMSDAEAGRQISKDLNTRMGSLGRQGWFKSKTFQDAAKLVALAPQWNEGLIMSELGAMRQAGQLVKDAAQGKRFYAGTLLRAVGGMAAMTFVVNQAINYITRGKPTWENPEEGIGAKLSAWIPDPEGGPGFFLNPLSLPAETTDLLLRRFERDKNMLDPINDYIRSRLSYVAAPASIMLSRKDSIGRPVREKDVPKEMAKSLLPEPIGFDSFIRTLVSEAGGQKYQGEFVSQGISKLGLKVEQAPSAEQRISNLAEEFSEKKGVEKSAEFYSGDYSDLTAALRLGNVDAAKKALALLRKKKTDSEIEKHYHRWSGLPLSDMEHETAGFPFTGSKAREAEFKRTLSPEQLATYDKAKEERRKVARLFQKLH